MECRVCLETIKDGAHKCTHCDSYQNRLRSLFNFSSLVLSLLVALIAVITASIPVVKSLEAPIASISYEVLSCTATELRVIAVNAGNSLAFVKGGTFREQVWKLGIAGEVPVMTPVARHVDFKLTRTGGALPAEGCDRHIDVQFSAPGASLEVKPINDGTCPC